jgi:class 3 adenylate cyclase/CHASE2 domain-containing sensor protein
MKLKPIKLIPVFVCAGALSIVCLLYALSARCPGFDFFQRLEWMTYDLRVRRAAALSPAIVDNLGFVQINDDTIAVLSYGLLGTNLQAGLYWPRHIYGRVVRELARQGAKGVALDTVFGELRPDHPRVPLPNGGTMESDQFFALQLKEASNVVLAATKDLVPPIKFRANALALGDISNEPDADGVLRRVKAVQKYRVWHPLINQAARVDSWDLSRTTVLPDKILFCKRDGGHISLPIDQDKLFDPTALSAAKPASGIVRLLPAFEDVDVWHMGIVLAARALQLDLTAAAVDEKRHRIVLSGAGGVRRVIPIDEQGRFLIDWNVRATEEKHLTREVFHWLLAWDWYREQGASNTFPTPFRDKLVVVGSTATGNDLTDRGSTPLEKDTLLASQHLNVANTLVMDRFIHPSSSAAELGLISALVLVAGLLGWQLRPVWASFGVGMVGLSYVFGAFYAYVAWRYWLPLVFPVSGLFLTHFGLMTYRGIFEHSEQRRIKRVFSKIVSPDIVHELLQSERLATEGEHRAVTVFFADVRGFTELTDMNKAMAEEYAFTHQLSEPEAERHLNEQAKQLLQTVNVYLSLIADIVKKHEGTLDKYIGDCVMAFWGAPTPNERHALTAVRAAIEVQRAIDALNQQRAAENQRREEENRTRAAQKQALLPRLELLHVGTGINTGVVTVGLMGSDAHIVNYTVFGREVNVASRLEGISGRGHIIIGESTYQQLLQNDPALAATCLERTPVAVKGLRVPVNIFEVPWKTATETAAEATKELHELRH